MLAGYRAHSKAYDEELARLDQLIAEMGGLAESQLADAVTALVRRDGELARKVAERDARIDALERIGDYVTNIAEHVHLMVYGELPEADRPKGDRSSLTVVKSLPANSDSSDTSGETPET